MTGPEKETLSQALELQRAVLSSLDAFRAEIMADLRSFRAEITGSIEAIDKRLSEVEMAALAQGSEMAGVAKYAAHQEIARDKKVTVRREWIRIAVAAAGVGATAASLVWGIFEFLRV